MLRLEHHFTGRRTSVYLRFNFDSAISNVPLVQGGNYLNDKQQIASRPVNGELDRCTSSRPPWSTN